MRRTLLPLLVIALTTGAAHADPAADARALVDRWLAAQNGGSYDAYAALYADSFVGTKRVGTTTRRMDRAAWLKDRKAMFRAPMIVGAADVKITTGATLAVDFAQTWRQGDFADTGHKRLTLDADAKAIVAEEMLDSHVLLTEGVCLRAVYPGASWSKRKVGPDPDDHDVLAVSVLDLGTTSICQVEVAGDDRENADVAIAAFTYKNAWTLGPRVDLTRPSFPTVPDGGSRTSTMSITPLDLAAREHVVDVVVVSDDDSGPMSSTHTEAHTLYRVTPDALTKIFDYGSQRDSSEADSETTCALTIEPRTRNGWHYLTVECHHWEDDNHGGGRHESDDRKRYRFDGTAYVPR